MLMNIIKCKKIILQNFVLYVFNNVNILNKDPCKKKKANHLFSASVCQSGSQVTAAQASLCSVAGVNN